MNIEEIPDYKMGETPENLPDKDLRLYRLVIAKRALRAGYECVVEDTEACITDMLTDLRHLCDALGIEFHACDRIAYTHYTAEKNHQGKCELDATAGFAAFVTQQDEDHNEGYSPKESVLNIDAIAKSEGLSAKWSEGDDDGMPIAVGTFTVSGGNQIGGTQISPDGKAIFLLNGLRYRGDYYFATADGETQDAAVKEIAGIIKIEKEVMT
ncbi:MAG: hypothetical protein WC405_17855 [Syntrophales bacterium]